MDVGVGRSVNDMLGGQSQLETFEVVADRLDEGQGAEQDRDVSLDLGGAPLDGRLNSDAAVEVMEDDRHHGSDDDGNEQPVDQELEKGKLEGVKADVLGELGILDA